MNVAGIIAEYNPFHRGHAYMIDAVKSALGSDTAVVCAMSGCFAQRGEWAAFRKQSRAEAAVRCGADLVLELPLPWSMSSAAGFAAGGVGLLDAVGMVTHLCFGSESGDLAELEAASNALEGPEFDGLIRQALTSGISYASARAEALERTAGSSAVLSGSNNILAVEYLRALKRCGSKMLPVTLKRTGAGHDEVTENAVLSASDIRRRLRAGAGIDGLVPERAAEVFDRELYAGRVILDAARLENALLARLRILPKSSYEELPDNSEGLGRRLYASVRRCPDIESILYETKTKRYAMSRIRRMLMCAALGIKSGDKECGVPYIKVLAMSGKGRGLLREMRTKASLPILIKPAAVRQFGERAARIFTLESDAADFCALAFKNSLDRVPGSDWRSTPFVL